MAAKEMVSARNIEKKMLDYKEETHAMRITMQALNNTSGCVHKT